MKLRYYPETDSLYIELQDAPSLESLEVRDGLVVDLDDKRVAIGLEIEHLSRFTENSGTQMGLDIHRRSDGDHGPVAAFGVDLDVLRDFVDGLGIQETVDRLLRQPA